MLTELIVSIVASVIVLQIMVFSTTIYLHRYATHRAMQMHPVAAWGFRFALWIAWIVMIVAESTGAVSGLGYVANNAREFMQMDLLVLTIVLWALLGKVSDVLARGLERRLLPWLPKAQRLEAT